MPTETPFETSVRTLVIAVSAMEKLFTHPMIRVSMRHVEHGIGWSYSRTESYLEVLVGDDWLRWQTLKALQPWELTRLLDHGEDLLELARVEEAKVTDAIVASVSRALPWLSSTESLEDPTDA